MKTNGVFLIYRSKRQPSLAQQRRGIMIHIRKRQVLAFAAAAFAVGMLAAAPASAAEPVKSAQYTGASPSSQPQQPMNRDDSSSSSSASASAKNEKCPYKKDASGQWIKASGVAVSAAELRKTSCESNNSGGSNSSTDSNGSRY